jgi:hypothetical protein
MVYDIRRFLKTLHPSAQHTLHFSTIYILVLDVRNLRQFVTSRSQGVTRGGSKKKAMGKADARDKKAKYQHSSRFQWNEFSNYSEFFLLLAVWVWTRSS